MALISHRIEKILVDIQLPLKIVKNYLYL